MSGLDAENREYTKLRSALLLCKSPARCEDLTALATACSCTIKASGWRLGEGVIIDETPPVDYLLVELLSNSDRPVHSIEELCAYLARYPASALVWTDMGMLEQLYSALPPEQCHFLVNASDVDAIPILSGALDRKKMNQLHDKGKDVEYGALHRISDELAQFARTLAQIAEKDGRPSIMSDKPVSFRPAPATAFERFVTGHETLDPQVHASAIREIIKLRRMRDSYFDSELFADPAWDILLDLMAAKLEGKSVSVSSLCIAAAVPATTALRWVAAMTDNGMLVRNHDPEDARRVFITLSDETEANLRRFLLDAQKRGINPV
jgi:hypothetical protein